MTDGLRDTIAAIATAPGRAAIAMLRVSGPAARGVAAALTGTAAESFEPRRPVLCAIRHPETGRPIDRVLLTVYPGPASYTGEDMLEISGHGGALAPARVLAAACAAGARPAEPGEFTRRAYLNGKLDLVQAEATLDLIDARTPRMGDAALFALERGLSRRVEAVREQVIGLAALLAYDIDFPDEDDGPVDRQRITAAAETLEADLRSMLRNAPEGELLRDGALVVVAGRPNAGKSSLFNALLGLERAIVTDVPGTTRDAIEALIAIDGYPFRLVDTAGLRADPEQIEHLGIEVARSYLRRADIVLACTESDRAPGEDERRFVAELENRPEGPIPVIVVRTKADRAPADGCSGYLRSSAEGEIRVSAIEGDGLAELRGAMLEAAFAGLRRTDTPPLVTRERQLRGLREALASLEAFSAGWEEGLPPEIVATRLEDASHALEGIVGAITSEDVLDAVFSAFCVGK